MSKEEEESCWAGHGLKRTYSEHAALVLRHLEQHRGYDAARATRSKSEYQLESYSEADDEDDEPTNEGSSTWRISSSTPDGSQHNRKSLEIGCGDSIRLSDEFSELSLKPHSRLQEWSYSNGDVARSPMTRKTTSSTEQRCQMFDEYDEEDDQITIVDTDEEDCESLDQHNNSMSMAEGITVSQTFLNLTPSHQRLSTTSLNHKISYEDWASTKQRELQRRKEEQRRAEIKRRELEELEKRKREEKERQDYKCYIEWLERKKREQLLKKKIAEKEQDLRERIQDVQDKAKMAKNIYLKHWRRKKTEQQKAAEKEQLKRQKRDEEEKQRRLQESVKAYEKWREKAKNIPRPATQGLLPHQKAKPAFTNPTPWQPLINSGSDDSDNDSQTRLPELPVKNQRSKRTLAKK